MVLFPKKIVFSSPSPPTSLLKVHLRGLPYRATEREIADWLTEAADPVEVTSLGLVD